MATTVREMLIRHNSLSLVMFGLFLLSFGGLTLTGHRAYNETQREHQAPVVSYWTYVGSGDFVEAVFENWESEFLQMGVYVLLTSILIQRGAAESKNPDEKEEQPEHHRDDPHAPWPVHRGGLILGIYKHSLSLSLLLLFVFSFALHALGGARAECHEQQLHHQSCQGTWAYLGSSRFWYESLQNWQSEFLSVGVLILLSIWLREQGSSQSKAVHEPHSKTGA